MTSIDGIRPAGIDNVFFIELDGKNMLSTLTRFPGEDTFEYEGGLYRLWNPSVSKLSSMLNKGMKAPLRKNSRILYLGAASGTTVSRVADIAAEGIVYAVEFAPRPARDLLKAIEYRENVVPIIADARYPEKYPPFIDSVDIIYQDVAQPDQAGIAVANADKYLVNEGILIMAIKAKSINSTGNIGDIFRNELEILETRFNIIDKMSLEPLHHNHLAVMGKYLSH
jgi:fibrillarin-like pre-rRNA processing protein